MTFFDWVGKIFFEYWLSFLKGTGNTLLMAIVGTLAGFLIGLLVAAVKTVPIRRQNAWFLRPIGFLLSAYIEIVRGTPMLVQALIVHYSLFVRIGMPSLVSAIIIISVNTGAYMAEIVRGGIISIDKGQFEGATSIGMSHSQTMLHVILPQVVRNILPSVSNEFVINIKDTSVLNVIGVTELYYFAGIIKRQNFQTFQTYFVVCVVYFILTFTVTCLLRFIEKKLDGKENYTIFGSQSDPNAEIHVKKEEAIPRD